MRSTIRRSQARPQGLEPILEEDFEGKKIKENLKKYSPFYQQSMRYSEAPASTLLYVSVSDFDSEEALKKIEAFDVDEKFRNKKIIFANLLHAEGPGKAGHWDVVIKNSDSYGVEHKIVAGDGKCGFVSSVLILSEICSEDDKKNKLSGLLHERESPQYERVEGSESQVRQVGTAPQFEVPQALIDGLTSADSETHKAKIADISVAHKDRIVNLLTLPSQPFLLHSEVHDIITKNDIYKQAVLAGNILDLTDLRTIENPDQSVLPTTFTRAGNQGEGLDLIRNRTLKSEFRNIVLEIMYEQKDKLDWNTDLRALVEEKLGKEFTQKIAIELGGEISLKTIFPTDELGDVRGESIARGFYIYKMNPTSITTAQKISEIFDVYLDKRPSLDDIEKVTACSSVCEQITNLRGLSENEKNRFIGKGDAFSQKAQSIYPSESMPQPLSPQLPPQLPPTLAQPLPPPLPKSSDEERSPELKAIADFLEPVNKFLRVHILNESGGGVPSPSPNPRRKDIFDTIGDICCSCVGQARK